SRERDVAVLRDIELPVHAEVAVEVGPAVRGSDVAAGAAHEGNRGSERKPDAVLVRRQELLARRFCGVTVVPPSAEVEVRREECEELESGEELRLALESRVDQDAGPMGVGDHFLDDAVAALALGVGDAHTERVILERLHAGIEVATLVVKEALAV